MFQPKLWVHPFFCTLTMKFDLMIVRFGKPPRGDGGGGAGSSTVGPCYRPSRFYEEIHREYLQKLRQQRYRATGPRRCRDRMTLKNSQARIWQNKGLRAEGRNPM